jgi:hypothetical protein
MSDTAKTRKPKMTTPEKIAFFQAKLEREQEAEAERKPMEDAYQELKRQWEELGNQMATLRKDFKNKYNKSLEPRKPKTP